MIFFKALGYLISSVMAFFSALLALYICWGGFSQGMGSGAIVIAAIVFAFATLPVSIFISYFLFEEKHILLKYVSLPIIAFVINLVGWNTMYAAGYVVKFVNIKKEIYQEQKFITDNFNDIIIEMKKGEGKHLDELAEVLKINNNKISVLAFKLMCKAKFQELIEDSPRTAPELLYNNLKTEIEYIRNGYYRFHYNTFYSTAFTILYWNKIKTIVSTVISTNCDKTYCDLSIDLDSDGYYHLDDVYLPEANSELLIKLLKTKYKQLIPSEKTTAEEFVNSLEIELGIKN